ncbi:MAG: hypothetical protein FWH26_05615 [Oscillospiraceae bacterium]|nr:hypothetical protein [Oscillospiraceae bacterium]
MALRKRAKHPPPLRREPEAASCPEPPRLPALERSFFDLLLRELSAGLRDMEQALRKSGGPEGEEARPACGRLRATVAYAQALLRLEELRALGGQPEQVDFAALLNQAVNALRREFLHAGVSVRRPQSEEPILLTVPREAFLFLLEEMLACCLRCSPGGRQLHIAVKRIDELLLLSLRSEGASVQYPPLLPLPGGDEAAPRSDYGFSLARILADMLPGRFRWEADGAGVRMFLEI